VRAIIPVICRTRWLIVSDDRQALYPAEVLGYEARAKGLAFLGIVSQIANLINTFGWVGITDALVLNKLMGIFW